MADVYRMLQMGDTVIAGDQYRMGSSWITCRTSVGMNIRRFDEGHYRRPLLPERTGFSNFIRKHD